MASELLYKIGTAAVFKASGGEVQFTPKNISSGSGWKSAVWDRGAGAKPALYNWTAKTVAAAALSVGRQVRMYLIQSRSASAGEIPGNFGTTDGAISSEDKLRNLGPPFGSINADSTSNGEPQIAQGQCFITHRYVMLAWWNDFGQSLKNDDADHSFVFDPVIGEQQ